MRRARPIPRECVKRRACEGRPLPERPTRAARRLAGAPAEEVAAFPPGVDRARAGRARSGSPSSSLAAPALAEATAGTERTGSLPRPAVERALVRLRRSASRGSTPPRGRAGRSARRISAGHRRCDSGLSQDPFPALLGQSCGPTEFQADRVLYTLSPAISNCGIAHQTVAGSL
jgi:hypothetical protein